MSSSASNFTNKRIFHEMFTDLFDIAEELLKSNNSKNSDLKLHYAKVRFILKQFHVGHFVAREIFHFATPSSLTWLMTWLTYYHGLSCDKVPKYIFSISGKPCEKES